MVVPPLGLVLDLVVPVPGSFEPVPVLGVVVVPDDLGVGAVGGIFGGVLVPPSGLIVVGVPSAPVGVVAVAVPGVVGTPGVVVAPGVVDGTCATVTTLGTALCGLGWVSAA